MPPPGDYPPLITAYTLLVARHSNEVYACFRECRQRYGHGFWVLCVHGADLEVEKLAVGAITAVYTTSETVERFGVPRKLTQEAISASERSRSQDGCVLFVVLREGNRFASQWSWIGSDARTRTFYATPNDTLDYWNDRHPIYHEVTESEFYGTGTGFSIFYSQEPE